MRSRQPALIPRSKTRILQNRSSAPVLVAATSLQIIRLPKIISKLWNSRRQVDHTPHQGYYNGEKDQMCQQSRKASSKTHNLSPVMSLSMSWPSTPWTRKTSSSSRKKMAHKYPGRTEESSSAHLQVKKTQFPT